jgi:hypothetical protein
MTKEKFPTLSEDDRQKIKAEIQALKKAADEQGLSIGKYIRKLIDNEPGKGKIQVDPGVKK